MTVSEYRKNIATLRRLVSAENDRADEAWENAIASGNQVDAGFQHGRQTSLNFVLGMIDEMTATSEPVDSGLDALDGAP